MNFKNLIPFSLHDYRLLFYLFVFSVYLLLSGIGISISSTKARGWIFFFYENYLAGFIIGIFLFCFLAVIRVCHILGIYFIYKRDVWKRFPFLFLIYLFTIAGGLGLIFAFQLGYEISINPSLWDAEMMLLCFAISPIYICLAPPASKALDRIPILKFLYPPINCHIFTSCHRKFRNEITYQKELFNNAFEKATATNRIRLKNILKECQSFLEEIITYEKNSKLRIKYRKTCDDIGNMINIIDWFKSNTNYARFVVRNKNYTKHLSDYILILDRILNLEY